MKRATRSPCLLAATLLPSLALTAIVPASVAQAAPASRPNILVIMGDDIGGFNISAYNRGMMGYRTPNIDSIANDGYLFTDWYASRATRPAARHSSPASRRSAPA